MHSCFSFGNADVTALNTAHTLQLTNMSCSRMSLVPMISSPLEQTATREHIALVNQSCERESKNYESDLQNSCYLFLFVFGSTDLDIEAGAKLK